MIVKSVKGRLSIKNRLPYKNQFRFWMERNEVRTGSVLNMSVILLNKSGWPFSKFLHVLIICKRANPVCYL